MTHMPCVMFEHDGNSETPMFSGDYCDDEEQARVYFSSIFILGIYER